jgi:hypothetical protein
VPPLGQATPKVLCPLWQPRSSHSGWVGKGGAARSTDQAIENALTCSSMPRIACWILAVGRSAHPANVRAIARSVRQSVRMKVAPHP